jgi:hypothetical protein
MHGKQLWVLLRGTWGQKGTRRDSFLKSIVILSAAAAAGVLKGNEFVCENYGRKKKMGVTV